MGLLGHGGLADRLVRDGLEGRLHHATLLEGPQGIGKRATADVVARALVCQQPNGLRPCDRCRACEACLRGLHPDVLVLTPPPDRASRTVPIERIRELIATLSLRAYQAPRRVVILDAADDLGPPAANALLKTLEEPNPDVHFFLISHQASGLLPTLRSRCVRQRLSPVGVPALVAWLEGRGIDSAQAAAAAAAADGCPGRALSLAQSGLEERRLLRDRVIQAWRGDGALRSDLAQQLSNGQRGEWGPTAELALELVDELLRDASLAWCEGAQPLLHPDQQATTQALANRLGAVGIVRCVRLGQTTRRQLAAFATGRTVLDAWLAGLAAEVRARP